MKARVYLMACVLATVGWEPAVACSKRATYGPWIHVGAARFVGTALPDTVLAGPGSVRGTLAAGHFGQARERPIHGQLFEVRNAGGAAPSDARQAVLVPWDYAADCAPVHWGNSARWVPPGTSGLYQGTLRDSSDWVGGIPTYDVHAPQFQPYTAERATTIGRGVTGKPFDVAELFELMKLLPRYEPAVDVAAAMRPLLEWARANPTVAARYPASEIVRGATYDVRRWHLGQLGSPMLGTYRFSVSVSGDAVASFFGRTYSRPVAAWDAAPTYDPSDPTRIAPITGYVLMVAGSATGDWSVRSMERESYLYLPVREGSSDSAGTLLWKGELQPDLVWKQVADPAVTAVLRLLPGMVPATYTLTGSGQARIEHRSRLADGREIVIIGDRISMATQPW